MARAGALLREGDPVRPGDGGGCEVSACFVEVSALPHQEAYPPMRMSSSREDDTDGTLFAFGGAGDGGRAFC